MEVLNLSYLSLILITLSIFTFLFIIFKPRSVKIPIKDRHVFITGGSKGIGLALAHQAAREGARVSILARSAEILEQAKQSIKLATGAEVAVFAVDVRDYDAVKLAVEAAGPIDVLIVNHGVFVSQELDRQDPDVVKMILDVNLRGSFNIVQAALPAMKNRTDCYPASIAFMSSQAGQVGVYGYGAYSATKFGLRGLAEVLQQEVLVHNIYVSIIFPPDTDTPGLQEDSKTRPEQTRKIGSLSSKMTADEVANVSLKGIKCGNFMIRCNVLHGLLIVIASAGFSPQRSVLMAFVEVFTIGICRLLALFMLWRVNRHIKMLHSSNLQSNESSK